VDDQHVGLTILTHIVGHVETLFHFSQFGDLTGPLQILPYFSARAHHPNDITHPNDTRFSGIFLREISWSHLHHRKKGQKYIKGNIKYSGQVTE
jgi:hypothetical protein